MYQPILVKISRTGNLTFLANEHTQAFGQIGTRKTKRASHVVPVSLPLRLAFQVLRLLVRDESRAAEWTRGWRCEWQADLSPVSGPVLGPYTSRKAAIFDEVEWLNKNILSV